MTVINLNSGRYTELQTKLTVMEKGESEGRKHRTNVPFKEHGRWYMFSDMLPSVFEKYELAQQFEDPRVPYNTFKVSI